MPKERYGKFPSYVLAPQAEHLWDADHLAKIKAIIANLPSVDQDRIYMLGHSMGGHGTNILIQLDPTYFAAIAPSAGTGRTNDEDFIEATIIKDVPTWAFHGDQDTVCPYEPQETLFKEMQQLGGNMKLHLDRSQSRCIGKFIQRQKRHHQQQRPLRLGASSATGFQASVVNWSASNLKQRQSL